MKNNDYHDSVTILVNSCDKYSDAWEPFFRLLKLYWPECENYKILLNTETKVYNCDFMKVETVCCGHTTWSKRIKKVLKQIDTELVVFLLEDFFLKSKVNQDDFLQVVSAMLQDKNIGYVGLKYRPDRKLKDGTYPTEKFIPREMLQINVFIPLISSIWNRKYLIELIRNHETPWEFEAYAGLRSRKYKYKVLDVNNNQNFSKAIFDYDIDMQYGIGISQGKWLMPKTKEYLDQHGIIVNYDNLGVDNETYYKAISAEQNTHTNENQREQESDPKLISYLYRIKRFLVKFPKNTKKKIRKIKSLF